MRGYNVKIMRKLCRPMSTINQLLTVVDNKLSRIVNNKISTVVDNILSTVLLENLSKVPLWTFFTLKISTWFDLELRHCRCGETEMFQALVCQDWSIIGKGWHFFMDFPSHFRFGYVRLEIGLMFHELAWTNWEVWNRREIIWIHPKILASSIHHAWKCPNLHPSPASDGMSDPVLQMSSLRCSNLSTFAFMKTVLYEHLP